MKSLILCLMLVIGSNAFAGNRCASRFIEAPSAQELDEIAIAKAFATDPNRRSAHPKNLELIDREMRETYEKLLEENSDLAVLSFEAWSTVERYRSGSHERLNGQLRSGQLSPTNEAFAQGLMAALRLLGPTRSYKGTVYRYINLPPAELRSFLEKYSVGNVVQESAFTSTNMVSLNWDTNVQLVIKSRTGVNINFEKLFPPFDREQEVLFPPGAKFRVNRIIPGDPVRQLPDSKVEWTLEIEEIR